MMEELRHTGATPRPGLMNLHSDLIFELYEYIAYV